MMREQSSSKEARRGRKSSFFSHRECEYFPCHKAVGTENFNCLFCYCPLYALGDKCGGNFRFLPDGVKDCAACALPHQRENYGMIIEKLKGVSGGREHA